MHIKKKKRVVAWYFFLKYHGGIIEMHNIYSWYNILVFLLKHFDRDNKFAIRGRIQIFELFKCTFRLRLIFERSPRLHIRFMHRFQNHRRRERIQTLALGRKYLFHLFKLALNAVMWIRIQSYKIKGKAEFNQQKWFLFSQEIIFFVAFFPNKS